MAKNKFINKLIQINIILISFFIFNQGYCATKTWSGAVSNDWKTGGNWVGNAVPANGDDALIPGGLTRYPVINNSVTIRTININNTGNGATLTITTGGVLKATGTVTITANGTLTQTDGTFTGTAIAVKGTYTKQNGTLTLTSAITISAGGIFNNIDGHSSIVGISNSGTYKHYNDTLVCNGLFDMLSGSSLFQYSGLIHMASSTSTAPNNHLQINANATVTQAGGTFAVKDFKLLAATSIFNQDTTSGSSLLTIGHDYKNSGGIFNSTGGTIEWTGASAAGAGADFTKGTNNFYNVVIKGSTTIGFTDNSYMYIRGNLTNLNTLSTLLSSKNSAVYYIGDGGHTLDGISDIILTNFIIEGTEGSAQYKLNVNLIVTGTLTMTSGNIDLNGNTLTLGTSATSTGTLVHDGTASDGWVFGGSFKRWFAKAIISDGSVAGMFPLGTSDSKNYFKPFYVSCPTAPTNGGSITIIYTDSETVSNVNFWDGSTLIEKRSDARWTVTHGDGLTGGKYNLKITGNGYGTIGSVDDLHLTLANSVIGDAGSNSGTIHSPVVVRNNLTFAMLFPSSKGDSTDFYLGSSNKENSPLPIELLSFDAKYINGSVNINWSTATETNNDYFTIERTTDGVNFTEIANIKGAGNSNRILKYSYTDDMPVSGISYYRLKQTDYDGAFEYFPLVSVNCKQISNISVYPNPNNGHFFIDGVSENSDVIILNGIGEQVYSLKSSGTTNEVNLGNVESGYHYIYIKSGQEEATQKVLINR